MTRDEIVDELMALLGSGRFTSAITSRLDGFDLKAAYEAVAMMRARREAGGDRVVGRKIGFTNRTIWQRYNVFAPDLELCLGIDSLRPGYSARPVSARGLFRASHRARDHVRTAPFPEAGDVTARDRRMHRVGGAWV